MPRAIVDIPRRESDETRHFSTKAEAMASEERLQDDFREYKSRCMWIM